MSNSIANNKPPTPVGVAVQNASDAIYDGKAAIPLKTVADIMPALDALGAAFRARMTDNKETSDKPASNDWREWMRYYASLPSIARLDDSLEFYPALVAKMKCDCLQLKRGWIMFGRPGSGKTCRAKIISDLLGIPMITARSMVLRLCCAGKVTSEATLRDMAGLGTVPLSGRTRGCDLIIDDLGTELPRATLFGTPIQPMVEMLSLRLDEWPRVRTYITTNMAENELKAHVGDRIWSRFEEQMAFMRFKAIDHRSCNANQTTVPSPPASANVPDSNTIHHQGDIAHDEGQIQPEDEDTTFGSDDMEQGGH